MRNEISIFLGSSLEEFKVEREGIKAFITDLNAKIKDREIYVDLIACEQENYKISNEGSQEKINQKIRDCDYSIFLFCKSIGQFTRQEFDVALNSFYEKKKPEIIVIVKKMSKSERTNELNNFINELYDKYKYYCCQYESIFDIEAIITDLVNNNRELVSINNGKIFLDEEQLVDINDNKSLQNNKELIKIHEEINTLRNEMLNASNSQKNELNEEIEKLSKKYNRLSTILNKIFYSMCQSYGFECTNEYIRAINLFKEGDITESKQEIEYNLRNRRDEQHKKLDLEYTNLDNYYKAIIKENSLLINFKLMNELSDENLLVIKTLYEENIELETKYGRDLLSEYNYGNFLFSIKDYDNAFNHLNKYISFELFKNLSQNASLSSLAKGLIRTGTIFSHLRQFDDARKCYQATVNIYEYFEKNEGNQYIYERANAYNKLGNVCDDLSDFDNGEYYHNKAIEIYKNNLDIKPSICGYELAYSYNKQGNIFRHKGINNKNLNYIYKAIDYYNLNEECLNKYVKDSPNYLTSLAVNQKSLGLAYLALNNPVEALKHFDNALESYGEYNDNRLFSIGFSYAKILFHKAQAMILLLDSNDCSFDEDDISDVLKENQRILLNLYKKGNNLRETIFELIRSYTMLDDIRSKHKYLEKIENLKNELKELYNKKLAATFNVEQISLLK